ncbi:MAG: extracellular solute-binding protein [Acetobacteraceae bacterium]
MRAALAAPAVVGARATGTVTVIAYDGFIPPGFKKQFEAETGIEVRIRLADSQAPELNLLIAERPHPLADIATVAANRLHQFSDAQLLSKLDVGRLTNWKLIDPLYTGSDWIKVNGDTMGVPLVVGAERLVTNTDKVPAPDSWGILFDPKYRRKITYVIEDTLQQTMLYQGADGTFASYVGKPEAAARAVDAARDTLIRNKSLVLKFYEDGAELQQMLLNEDVYVAQAYAGTPAKLILVGQPIRTTIPKEGSTAVVYNFSILKNGANQDNAYRFLDALLGARDIGAALSRSAGYTNTFINGSDALTDAEKRAFLLTESELRRLRFLSYEGQKLSSALIDRAVEQVKAA